MAGINFDRMRETAKRMVEANGVSLTFRITIPGVYDPIADTRTDTEEQHDAFAILLGRSENEVPASAGEYERVRVLMPALDLPFVPEPGIRVDLPPSNVTYVTDEPLTYTAPDGSPIHYEIEATTQTGALPVA